MESTEYKLEFISFDVQKVLFDRKTNDREYEFGINIKQALIDINDNEESVFRAGFLVEITGTSEEKPISIKVEAGGIFKIHNSPPHEVVENFKYISAPSIVYPYLRSFISLLTLNAGLNPVNLPSVNFLKQYKESQAG